MKPKTHMPERFAQQQDKDVPDFLHFYIFLSAGDLYEIMWVVAMYRHITRLSSFILSITCIVFFPFELFFSFFDVNILFDETPQLLIPSVYLSNT